MSLRIISYIICFFCTFTTSMAKSDLSRLESVLAHRDDYISTKEHRIDSIKSDLKKRSDRKDTLDAYEALYHEYLVFRFDSAMIYLDRAEKLIGESADYDYRCRIKIYRALALATSGHFSQAIGLLKAINAENLSIKNRQEYYAAMEWTYGVWAEYSGNTEYANEYNKQSIVYLDSLLSTLDKNTPEYMYHSADQSLRLKDYEKARDLYLNAIKPLRQDTRMYAQAAYGLAMAYKQLGDLDNYRKWLINAAISDQITPLKENLALQELALLIRNEDEDLETANRYLNYSLEDATFYNNRLRLLEISEKIPEIAIGYQNKIATQNWRLRLSMLGIIILVIGLCIMIWYVVQQKKRVSQSKETLSGLNAQLNELNAKLSQTNVIREQYVSLFMDLCAAYIEKLNRFRSTVILKIKAKQIDDLLRVANNNARPSEAEMKELFFNFDTAFLKLYPDFINKFNSLLQPGKEILPRQNELLNTDLRIFALIRMGITDSNKIATLLFYSPQTIFNHRTQVRNRAQNRDTFEQDLMNICSIMP